MQNDMKSTIQAAVAEAVEKTMGRQLELQRRQLELLEKVVQFLGIEAGPTREASAPKRASASVPAPKRPSSVPVRKWVRPQAAPKPAKAGPAPQKGRGRPHGAGRAAKPMPAATSSSPGPATSVPYAEGQEVRYKQGRGAFTAKVKAVDEKAKTVTLARVSDGRKVVRPFDKVTPA
ncbi:PspA [Myxococcus llanfairpwllgwyngyllgogerychwyrndrobwllllantysiliogogogochensis]|uniref:PspA n=1 Tax=Myxococcus llanfairpwllgwyngyllgogerychwyrndrobwllllantysiliogogogochensis TaxID=2590453 RepID=A0A540WIB2_9BACT|nr:MULTISPECIES: PspA [Myxococcus]TQF08759.1 PspA [Myxococcus llanfairpwllgwyngyllgogerychwyrndrobwllllantysiliogogogochensis]